VFDALTNHRIAGIQRISLALDFRFAHLKRGPIESTLLPEFFPSPKPVRGLSRQRETQLMGQHAYLAAMVGIVHNHVSEHGRAGRPCSGPTVAAELSHTTVRAAQGFSQHFRAKECALCQCNLRLMLRAPRAIELGGKLHMRGGEPQPLATNVVHVRKNSCNGPRIAAVRLRSPRPRVQMLEDELVHAIIHGIGFEQRLAKILRGQSRATYIDTLESAWDIQPNAKLCLQGKC
jgi:hypothetical protein